MDKTKNPAVVGAGPYDGNGAVPTSCMNATTIVIKRGEPLKPSKTCNSLDRRFWEGLVDEITGGPDGLAQLPALLCDIADAAMGMAFASTLGPDESFTTIELKINFFRPVWQAQLRAEGVVVQRGRNIGYVECSITDEQRRVIARASSTCMVLRGDMAGGR